MKRRTMLKAAAAALALPAYVRAGVLMPVQPLLPSAAGVHMTATVVFDTPPDTSAMTMGGAVTRTLDSGVMVVEYDPVLVTGRYGRIVVEASGLRWEELPAHVFVAPPTPPAER